MQTNGARAMQAALNGVCGLPINDLARYAVLLIGSIAIFSNAIRLRPARWCAAFAVLAIVVAGQWLWPAPRIEMIDGFNSGWIEFEDGVNERVVGTTGYPAVLAELVKRAG